MSQRTTVVVRQPRKAKKGEKHLTKTQKEDVKKVVGRIAELKYLNFNPNAATAIIAPAILNLTAGISQGLTDNSRVGDAIRLKNMSISVFFNTVAGERNRFRYILFQWKPDNSVSAPNSGDILLLGTTGVENFTSQYNHDKRHLYRIIMDHRYDLVGSGQGTADPYQDSSMQSKNHFIRSFPLPNVQYNANTTSGMNQLYFMFMSDQNSTSGVLYYYTAKLVYTDT